MTGPPQDTAAPPWTLILPAATLLALHALALVLLTRTAGIPAGTDLFGTYNIAAAMGETILLAWVLRKAGDGKTPLRLVRGLAWGIPPLDLVITAALALATRP